MDLGSTQPLTEMSTTNIFWGLRRPVRRAENLSTFMCRLSEIWQPQPPGTLKAYNSYWVTFLCQHSNTERHAQSIPSFRVKLLTYFHEIRYEYLAAGSSF